jgi:hypothetical protein
VSASASHVSPRSRCAAFSEAVVRSTNEHPVISFAVLSAWYVALVWKLATRPLWFDELYTFYIAQQPTVGRMMEAIRTIDLNPPLNYFLTRWSISVFGVIPWATRLPALVAFWMGSAAIFVVLRRRATALVAGIGVLLFWSSPYFPYAAEARPYGLLLGLSAVLLAAWDPAIPPSRQKLALATVFVSATLVLLAHLFGALSLGAVWVGEAVRSWRRRRVDWSMVAALVLPLIATLTYRPLLHTYGNTMFPPEAQVTWGKLCFLYYAVFRWMWRPLLVIAIFAALAWRRHYRVLHGHYRVVAVESRIVTGSPDVHTYSRFSSEMSAALTALFLIPVAITLVFMRSHGAFYDRYGMAVVIPIALVAPLFLNLWLRVGASVAVRAFCWIALLLLLSTSLRVPLDRTANALLPRRAATKITGIVSTSVHGPFRPWWKKLPVPDQLLKERERAPLIASPNAFHPELPIVAASELTFVEMDNRESAQITSRLYLLYDHQSEIEISHRSVATGMLKVKNFFPLRGTMIPYSNFVTQHGQFLVVGLYEHPGDWLLRKLTADGADLHIVGRIGGYDDNDVYLVTYPTGK